LNHSTGRWRRVINRVSSYIRRKNKEPKNNRSPLRDVSFWLRTAQIYSSYKFSQLKNGVKMPKFLSNKKSMNQTWSEIHEINSNRMIRLCLGLRGFYLKTGQFLGTRYDFMPPTYTRKLSQLHDNVPPMSASEAKKYIEKELNGTLEEYFSSIDLSKPIGSASIAQVHQGIWKSTGNNYLILTTYISQPAFIQYVSIKVKKLLLKFNFLMQNV
jgi:predicted unusual protein kinase regulating ubiquinone biosynthesis (AarF/ABC1/UbiB family)